MMISNSIKAPTDVYVWVWLPAAMEPVVAGRLTHRGDQVVFAYGRSYLARSDAIALYEPELPLKPGPQTPLTGLTMPGCVRDASPDAWGRRVIINRLIGAAGVESAELDELTFLLESGSERVGALDFQAAPDRYTPRIVASATLDDLLSAAERVDWGLPIPPALDNALFHGTSIGGARPKAIIEDQGKWFIAKFSASSDLYHVVKAEFVAMRLAALCGIDVAPVSLARAAGKDVLLVERFDRVPTPQGWQRKAVVSALTLLGLDEMMARYASYQDLAEIIRCRFVDPKGTLRELFGRISFNILCGNTDDHARNHAAFWEGHHLRLTPAFDICPQGRTGNEASQAMLIHGTQRQSQLAAVLDAAAQFLLPEEDAVDVVRRQIETVRAHWDPVCDEAGLNPTDRQRLWRRQILNPYTFEGLKGGRQALAARL